MGSEPGSMAALHQKLCALPFDPDFIRLRLDNLRRVSHSNDQTLFALEHRLNHTEVRSPGVPGPRRQHVPHQQRLGRDPLGNTLMVELHIDYNDEDYKTDRERNRLYQLWVSKVS